MSKRFVDRGRQGLANALLNEAGKPDGNRPSGKGRLNHPR